MTDPSSPAATNEVNQNANQPTLEDQGKPASPGALFKKKKRKKSSPVWDEFEEIKTKDGKKKARCIHCNEKLSIQSSGSTSHLKRHLQDSCDKRALKLKSQSKLNFQPQESKVEAPILFSGKYDHANCPSEDEWKRVQQVVKILEVFSETTNMISGSEYPTSNKYLTVVGRVKEILDKREFDEDFFVSNMVMEMKEKFDKYWGESNLLMSIAAVLDPRCKMMMIEFVFDTLYSKEEAENQTRKVHKALIDLFNEYKDVNEMFQSSRGSHGPISSYSSDTRNGSSSTSKDTLSSSWSRFDEFMRGKEKVQPEKSELEIYLEEGRYRMKDGDDESKFDALEWWKSNELKYKILSKMACDILAIPASTVASESTFSAGSRVIDPYRSSLAKETVQALICGGDWVRRLHGMKKKSKGDEEPLEISLADPS